MAILTHPITDKNGGILPVGTSVMLISRDDHNVVIELPDGEMITMGAAVIAPRKPRLMIEVDNDALRHRFPSPHSLVE